MPPTSRPVNYADDGTRLRGVLFKDDTQRSRTPGILLVHGAPVWMHTPGNRPNAGRRSATPSWPVTCTAKGWPATGTG